MLRFKAILKKFNEQGEKTGWTYIEVPIEVSEKLKPGQKKAYRIKGKIDDHTFEKVSLIPMGGGHFIIPINATMRKAIHKAKGATVDMRIEVDDEPIKIDTDFLQCLEDEPIAKDFFFSLPQSHRNYFSKWIESAKTETTKAKRIANAINGLSKKLGYGPMLRQLKSEM